MILRLIIAEFRLVTNRWTNGRTDRSIYCFFLYFTLLGVSNVLNVLNVRGKRVFYSLSIFFVFRFLELFISATNRSLLLGRIAEAVSDDGLLLHTE